MLTAIREDLVTPLGDDFEDLTEACASVTFVAPANELVYLRVSQKNGPLYGTTHSLVVTPQ